jgi:heme-degrading monooxygenase HmoA
MQIMRVYRCVVVAGKEGEFREYAFGKSHPRLRAQPGLQAFFAARPLPGNDDRTRCMVQIWESVSAIEAALGKGWREPPELPAEAQVFVESQAVEHYELADEFRAETT